MPELLSHQEVTYRWLFAVGLHNTMMTMRMMEKRRCQKASSTHSSFQSCKHITPPINYTDSYRDVHTYILYQCIYIRLYQTWQYYHNKSHTSDTRVILKVGYCVTVRSRGIKTVLTVMQSLILCCTSDQIM